MNTEAIYSDETGQYVIPMEANPGDRVTIRLRVAHGHAREIYLLAQDTHYLMRPAQASVLITMRHRCSWETSHFPIVFQFGRMSRSNAILINTA